MNLVLKLCQGLRYAADPDDVVDALRLAKVPKEEVAQAIERGDPGHLEEWFAAVQLAAAPERAKRSERESRRIGPSTFWDIPTDEIAQKLHPKLCTLLASYDGGNVTIIGPTGCGKSLAAVALLRRELRRPVVTENRKIYVGGLMFDPVPHGCGWYRAHDLHSALLRHPLGEGTPEILQSAKRDKLAVIDDLQTAPKDDTTIEVLWSRYDDGLPTIATCGMTKDRFLERFGDAFGRRLIESNGERGTFVDCF